MYQDTIFDCPDFSYERDSVSFSPANMTTRGNVASLADILDPASPGPKMATKLEILQWRDASCSSDSYTDSETSSLAVDCESVCEEEGEELHQTFPFLSLPLEVRLQIYGWVHLLHPVRQAQLAPWYPTPAHGSYFVRAVRVHGPLSPNTAAVDRHSARRLPREATGIIHPYTSNAVAAQNTGREEPRLLSPHRPLATLPASLLLLNRQVYHEARMLPLHTNEFVFTNWFASGLWAARSLLASLRPWQRDALHWVRLELLTGDLASPVFSREWTELCRDFWARGLRGLRLKILAHGSGSAGFAGSRLSGVGMGLGMGMGMGLALMGTSGTSDGLPRQGVPAPPVRAPGGGPARWVGKYGLAGLRALRALEVELLVADWSDARKVAWCAELEDVVNEARAANGVWTEERLPVVCVERDPRRRPLDL